MIIMATSLDIPIIILKHHIHLSLEDAYLLLGEAAARGLPDQYVISVKGPKGILRNVKVLMPLREETQVELSRYAALEIGVKPVLRNSGDLEGTTGAELIGPAGALSISGGVIIPASYLQLSEEDAVGMGLKAGERIDVTVKGVKTIDLHEVLVKVVQSSESLFMMNLDEANAAMVDESSRAVIQAPEPHYFYDHQGEAVPVPGFEGIRVSQIKKATSPLAQEAIDLCTNIFEFSHEEKRRFTSNLLALQRGEKDNYFFLAAYDDERVVAVTSTYYLPDVKMAFMEFVAVANDRQRRGLGTFIYHQTLDAMEKAGKQLRAMVFEVRSTKDGLAKRKDFFLNLGAVPIDLKFYPIGHKMDPELMLMFKPLSGDFCLNSSMLVRFFSSLSKTLMD